jgi:hypothetical protein
VVFALPLFFCFACLLLFGFFFATLSSSVVFN